MLVGTSLDHMLSLNGQTSGTRLHRRYSCTSVLQLVDKSIVQVCKADEDSNGRFEARKYLTKQDAPTLYRLARDLHLDSFEEHVGEFMGEFAADIDLTRVDRSTAAILRGAFKIVR